MSKTAFIIGAGGMVGATAANALAIKEVVHEIVLIDIAEELVHGQAMDINHTTAYTNGVRVRVGDYDEIKRDDIVVITSGMPQQPGQSRLELVGANAKIMRDVVQKVMKQGEEVYLMIVSNPVDALTYVALKESGLPKNRVFGTGTSLDTARLRVTLANELHISQQEIEAYVLGEHGDSSFSAISGARIGGIPLKDFPGFSESLVHHIDQDIRDAAYRIIQAKKSTYYGIGQVVAQITATLQQNAAGIFPVCSLAEGEYGLSDVVIGLPSLVSNKGVTILDNYPLSKDELAQLHKSAEIVKQAIQSL